MVEMNIYIFLPHNWSFCRGMCIAVAENIDTAISLLHNHFREEDDEGIFEGVITDNPEDSRLKKDHWDQWLLKESLPIAEAENRNYVIVSYNES